MGQMRFLTPRPEQVSEHAARAAYLAGLEGIPWRSDNRIEDDILTLDRETSESGNLFIPWNVPGRGSIVLSTASLMERERPYHLPVELARGTLNRLRHQTYIWQNAGYTLPETYCHLADTAMRLFIEAATSQADPVAAGDQAGEATRAALEAIEMGTTCYTREAIERRHQRENRLPTMMAVNVGSTALSQVETQNVLSAFNSAAVPVVWRHLEPNAGEFDWNSLDAQVEWCRGLGLRVCGGPLLRLDKGLLPDWIYLWEDDFEQVDACVSQFIQAAVARYHGKMHAWHCAARLNSGTALSMTEEETIRLAVTAIDATRRADSKTPIIVSFDQPWAEYLARSERELSPLHFADALVRAELGIAGLGLEINLGYWPGGTLRRDLLEFSQQIDRWLGFGLPLLVMLTLPSGDGEEPAAARQAWTLDDAFPESQEAHANWVEQVVSLLLAKTGVHGIIWNQLHDAGPHEFAHGGLFDPQHQPKSALERLTALRKKHLV